MEKSESATGDVAGEQQPMETQTLVETQPLVEPKQPMEMQTARAEGSATAQPGAAGVKAGEKSASSAGGEEDCAPTLGTRVEVLWKITHDDGRVEERWWGAVVQDRTQERVGDISAEHGDKKIHILLYDAYGEFDEDVSRVAFLPNGVLLDVTQVHDENKGLLDWRVEGDEHDEPVQMSLDDMVEANAACLAEAGVPDNADLMYLSGLPAHVQIHMTSGYRVFADGVREMLSELSAKHPEGYVVTENDVREMYAKMKR